MVYTKVLSMPDGRSNRESALHVRNTTHTSVHLCTKNGSIAGGSVYTLASTQDRELGSAARTFTKGPATHKYAHMFEDSVGPQQDQDTCR